jgi:DNA-directed RNA polymerase beta subunit
MFNHQNKFSIWRNSFFVLRGQMLFQKNQHLHLGLGEFSCLHFKGGGKLGSLAPGNFRNLGALPQSTKSMGFLGTERTFIKPTGSTPVEGLPGKELNNLLPPLSCPPKGGLGGYPGWGVKQKNGALPNNPPNGGDNLPKSKKLKWVPMEYKLETFQRSNQDTCLNQKPSVSEGDWVQSGDLLTDCASSVGGELALGQNLLIAYMPWEGYNFEDAILISERLVIDDLYTSVHIERYDIETHNTKLGNEEITRDIPDVSEKQIEQLDSCGIVKLGSWVEEGDILVGKITPINKKAISPYQKLLYTILEKQVRPFRDTSLRAPKGIKAKVINIKYFLRSSGMLPSSALPSRVTHLKGGTTGLVDRAKTGQKKASSIRSAKGKGQNLGLSGNTMKQQIPPGNPPVPPSGGRKGGNTVGVNFHGNETATMRQNPLMFFSNVNETFLKPRFMRRKFNSKTSFYKKLSHYVALKSFKNGEGQNYGFDSTLEMGRGKKKQGKTLLARRGVVGPQRGGTTSNSLNLVKLFHGALSKTQGASLNSFSYTGKRKSPTTLLKQIETIHIYLAEKRKIQVGDKMAGRHGNKGIVSQILPIQDMPYLPDGSPIDMVLNPLGVPSRMNVGQIYECLLGLAGKYLGENYKVISFDEVYGPEASRSFVFNKLYEASSKTGLKWLFDPNSPGKIRLYDGRTGDTLDQTVTVGRAYMLRLVHMVDDKIHMRSTGPYSLVTQQPLRGRSKQGGQRLGEMEVWALEGYGAAFTLLEMLTIKSDDMTGRMTLWSNLILNREISIGTPESFKVLICELQALCMDIGLFRYNQTLNKVNDDESLDQNEISTQTNILAKRKSDSTNSSNKNNQLSSNQFTEIKNLINLP